MKAGWSDSVGVMDLQAMMHDMYPAVEDERDDYLRYEHPLTAIGAVLLTAALLGSIDHEVLVTFTGYSPAFVSAISFNMNNNRLWENGCYDISAWLAEGESINHDELWNHIEIANGTMDMAAVKSSVFADPCGIYWDERGGFSR